jgi:hypothetical protein
MYICRARLFALVFLALLNAWPRSAQAEQGCPVPVLASGLILPIGMVQSNLDNLIVAESGTGASNTGRLSIVGRNGTRRTLLEGLPSGINDVGEPSGPAGLFMRGRTLYVLIGVGDVGRPGPVPGTTVPNPNPLSSPLFSSVLALHLSAQVERTTNGFVLTTPDQQALAAGQPVTLSQGGSHTLTIERVADFENYISNPLPFFAGNVRLSNPFALVERDDRLYVTDGGRNLVWAVDVATGSMSILSTFPPITNPVAPFGPPVLDAVPTGIALLADTLLVTLFRGFPFPPGTSVVEAIDLASGAHAPLVSGLKTAIGVVPVDLGSSSRLVVLQHVSGAPGPPQTGGPGSATLVTESSRLLVTDCLTRPTTMTLDGKTGTLYVAELGGQILAIELGQ